MAEHKLAIFSFIVAIVLLGIVIFIRLPQVKFEPPPPPPPAAPLAPPGATAQTYLVSMDASGFIPPELSVRVGDEVIFRNNDARQHWPASDPHPTHEGCPGFDAQKPIAFGDSYRYRFSQAAACPYHDHILPALTGKITVTE